jgi:hypothetical protein
MKNQILFILVLSLFISPTFAVTYTAVSSGDWNQASTWDVNGIPPTNVDGDITIPASYTVTMTSDVVVSANANYTITVEGSLIDDASVYKLTLGKKAILVVNGTLNIDSLELEYFSGVGIQPTATFGSSSTTTLVSLESGGLITNNGSLTVTGTINRVNGTLTNNVGGEIHTNNLTNNGTVDNYGDITVYDTLTNNSGATITNDDAGGASFTAATIVNNGTINGSVTEGDSGTFPIELLSFSLDIEGQDVIVRWVTASEENNKLFVLFHSTNGIDYHEIENISGAGTTAHTMYYQTIHNTPSSGVNYYYLKQIDFDGSYTEFEPSIIYLSSDELEDAIHINYDLLSLNLNSTQKVIISIIDMKGQVLFSKSITKADWSYNLTNLKTGAYQVILNSGSKTTVKRFVKM